MTKESLGDRKLRMIPLGFFPAVFVVLILGGLVYTDVTKTPADDDLIANSTIGDITGSSGSMANISMSEESLNPNDSSSDNISSIIRKWKETVSLAA